MTYRTTAGRSAGVAILALLCLVAAATTPGMAAEHKKYKILHVMSYHTPWRWTEGQLRGFEEGLGKSLAEYKVFEMDTKRHGTREWAEAKGKDARALIDAWQPDLIYTTDDDAQEYVARYYVNTKFPIVFSGVNKNPANYGFEGSRNVTGVLEQEHSAESVTLLRGLVPEVKKIAAVFDDSPMWEPVVQRMKDRIRQIPVVEIVAWDTIKTYDDYKLKIKEYQGTADAIALIGIFNFKDADGRNVPYQDVLRWTAENSKLPDFGFWIDRVHHGTLAAVTVSEYEQGLAAGRLARAILVDRIPPSTLPMRPTEKGLPVVSLARAKALGFQIKSSILLSTEVVDRFEWERK